MRGDGRKLRDGMRAARGCGAVAACAGRTASGRSERTGAAHTAVSGRAFKGERRGRGEALEYAFSCARGADADLDACYTGDEERMKAYMRRGTALLLIDAGDEGLLRLGQAAFSGRGEGLNEGGETRVRALMRV